MRLRIAPVRFVVVAASTAVCGIVAVAFVAGCGSTAEPAMPHLATGATVDPKSGEASITITASGVGIARTAFVLTYPDGHRALLGTAQYQDADSSVYTPSSRPKGKYAYTVYATPLTHQGAPPLTVGYFTARYAVASGTFTIR
jgi:hypothetical protein